MKNSNVRTFLICFVVIIIILILSGLEQLKGGGNIIAFVLLAVPFILAAQSHAEAMFPHGILVVFVLVALLEAFLISFVITAINWFLKKPEK